ncbi:hypothetical protein HS088_TW01G00748 [Tripterygium wilfordii]|uniref:Uncharacterized protein n=1 Tax=Tripterygium wilfordii TaxID=458696 RepID=A0A7J7E2G2_TRIWF|nr:uncharacterized protein LOC120009432 [Tripterygium wilfordii]XP_038716069.1 uncharacterized protein LOC120009432 [Tripterygium wilfordii]XP_038716141.1 uncharacterized protein LOC120009432 [Tripterygium wilfordii]KAF5752830.1 hypothetical protein HS088_TW01G00748 [Tripterygium wilfordii]
MGHPRPTSESSSSGEEDGDAEWKAAIESIAATTTFGSSNTTTTKRETVEADREHPSDVRKLKHYQLKAQKMLDDILEKTLEVANDPIHVPDSETMMNDGGVRLFKHSSPGIVFDHIDEFQRPTKRPRILPGLVIEEKSKKFKQLLQSIVVDGADIIAAARVASQKSLNRLEAKDAAAKEKTKREEERVAELKTIRGEKWLPSMAREMQRNSVPRSKYFS